MIPGSPIMAYFQFPNRSSTLEGARVVRRMTRVSWVLVAAQLLLLTFPMWRLWTVLHQSSSLNSSGGSRRRILDTLDVFAVVLVMLLGAVGARGFLLVRRVCAREQTHCPECNYPRPGVPGTICPECGTGYTLRKDRTTDSRVARSA